MNELDGVEGGGSKMGNSRVITTGTTCQGSPDSSVDKESACNAGGPSSIPGLGRSPGEGLGYPLQYSCASLVAQLVKNPPAMWRPGFDPWVGKIPWRRERLPTPVFLPGESDAQKSLVGYNPRAHKELDMTERLTHTLQKKKQEYLLTTLFGGAREKEKPLLQNSSNKKQTS